MLWNYIMAAILLFCPTSWYRQTEGHKVRISCDFKVPIRVWWPLQLPSSSASTLIMLPTLMVIGNCAVWHWKRHWCYGIGLQDQVLPLEHNWRITSYKEIRINLVSAYLCIGGIIIKYFQVPIHIHYVSNYFYLFFIENLLNISFKYSTVQQRI